MKNASLILNVVLLVAVVVLFVLHFSSGKSSGGSLTGASSGPSNLKVAYVNQDTVLKYYDFVKVNSEKFDAKAKDADKQLTTRQEALQREVQQYRANVGTLTIGQAQAIEQSLQQKGQNLQMLEQQLTQQMGEEQQRIATELYQKITDYLKVYSKERGIEVILKLDRGSDLLYAGDSLDISKDVVKGLNEAWKAESSKAPAKSDTTKAKSK
jgi:outer membrane protein